MQDWLLNHWLAILIVSSHWLQCTNPWRDPQNVMLDSQNRPAIVELGLLCGHKVGDLYRLIHFFDRAMRVGGNKVKRCETGAPSHGGEDGWVRDEGPTHAPTHACVLPLCIMHLG